jgi:hypothetical protein
LDATVISTIWLSSISVNFGLSGPFCPDFAPGIEGLTLSDGPQFVNIRMRIMNTKRTHIVISEQLATDIDRVVGKRGRSSFLAQAAERELLRLRQIKALEAASGAWKDKDHPELKDGSATWVKKIRRENERRSSKSTH